MPMKRTELKQRNQANLHPPNMREINITADALADLLWCSSCSGIGKEDKHCLSCTSEAKTAIRAFLSARRKGYKPT